MEHGGLKVVVEANVAFMRGALEQLPGVAEAVYLPAAEITPAAVADADALIVRTRTRCNAALLKGSRVRLVGTATIGTDHIDLGWCAGNGIEVVSAPGCNAPAVNQYVWQALADVGALAPASIGIVGVGHVGRFVEAEARRRGWRVMRNDPPRAAAEGQAGFCSLADITAEADVVTVHTPLDTTTRRLLDADFFAACRRKPVVINAARGGIVDEGALKQALREGKVSHAVIDCWQGEPAIDRELLDLASVASPHIAGYSLEGKQRAARAMLLAVSRLASGPDAARPLADSPAEPCVNVPSPFDLRSISNALKADPATFEQQRNSYPLRPE